MAITINTVLPTSYKTKNPLSAKLRSSGFHESPEGNFHHGLIFELLFTQEEFQMAEEVVICREQVGRVRRMGQSFVAQVPQFLHRLKCDVRSSVIMEQIGNFLVSKTGRILANFWCTIFNLAQ